jgi:hypothetical protein
MLVACLLLTLCACSSGNLERGTATSPPEPSSQTSSPPQASEPSESSPTSPAIIPGDSPIPSEEAADSADISGTPVTLTGEVVISFDYERQSGSASNQYAVWIEDMDGSLIKTLYASQWTANGGYQTRPDSIAIWVERSGLVTMTNAEVDAVSGATPRTGEQSYTWDLTDEDGNAVSPGEYCVLIEGTLRWRNYVLYSATIELGNAPVEVQADAEFFYEATDRYGALTGDSPENNMIGAVTIQFAPGG